MNNNIDERRNTSSVGEEKRGAYTYEYPRPALTADCVIFGFDGKMLKVLLIERGVEPFKGMWALPGGFMRMSESIEQCALRELYEETNMKDIYMEQFHTFSAPSRDPRGRVVTVAFIALVRPEQFHVKGGDDATLAAWFDIDMLPPLAFDHLEILKAARSYLKEQLRIKPIAFQLVNEVFSVDELRKVYEVIMNQSFDRRNFERKLLSADIVEAEGEHEQIKGKRIFRKFRLNLQKVGRISPPADMEDKKTRYCCTPNAADDIERSQADVFDVVCCSSMASEDICESMIGDEIPDNVKLKKKKKDSDGSIKDLFNF